MRALALRLADGGTYPCRPRTFHHGREPILGKDQVTIASFLREHGYATGMVGKWHLGFEGGPATTGEDLLGGPVDRGFDRFFGIHASLDIPPYYYIRDPHAGRAAGGARRSTVRAGGLDQDPRGLLGVRARSLRVSSMPTCCPRFEQEAVSYLNERVDASEPFFLYVALAGPHTPWLPSAEHVGSSGASMYGDFVAQVDSTLGAIFEALEENGQAENTLVIFTSDNGPVWYPADDERFGHLACGGLRGMKSDAWEGGHRMPFLLRWPGRVRAGEVCAQTVCFTDVLPTLADVVGEALPTGVGADGHSLTPVFRDPGAPTGREWTVLKSDASGGPCREVEVDHAPRVGRLLEAEAGRPSARRTAGAAVRPRSGSRRDHESVERAAGRGRRADAHPGRVRGVIRGLARSGPRRSVCAVRLARCPDDIGRTRNVGASAPST